MEGSASDSCAREGAASNIKSLAGNLGESDLLHFISWETMGG